MIIEIVHVPCPTTSDRECSLVIDLVLVLDGDADKCFPSRMFDGNRSSLNPLFSHRRANCRA